MIDPTWSLYDRERRRDMLREAEHSHKLKAIRSYAPNHSPRRQIRNRRSPAPMWKQLLAAILGH